ncbi:MAG: shikimate kinase [Methanosarcinaceae archaeon]|nr:shikimate kinase [Methanosarcinaceae archaeon]
MNNITLIGMAGVGKSTIGKLLAKKLGYSFIDIDLIIKKKIGTDLQTFLDTASDRALIDIEQGSILELDFQPDDRCIISPGGSVVYSEDAMRYLKEISTIVFLDTSFKNIVRRISDPSSRGLIGFKNMDLKKLYQERNVLYRKYADVTITVKTYDRKSVVVERVLRELEPFQ